MYQKETLDNDRIYKRLINVHDTYVDWRFIQNKKYVIASEFIDKTCPFPDNACDIITYYKELPLKVLIKSKHDVTGPYHAKQKMDTKEYIIPGEVIILEDKTTSSLSTSSTISSVMNKNFSASCDSLPKA